MEARRKAEEEERRRQEEEDKKAAAVLQVTFLFVLFWQYMIKTSLHSHRVWNEVVPCMIEP